MDKDFLSSLRQCFVDLGSDTWIHHTSSVDDKTRRSSRRWEGCQTQSTYVGIRSNRRCVSRNVDFEYFMNQILFLYPVVLKNRLRWTASRKRCFITISCIVPTCLKRTHKYGATDNGTNNGSLTGLRISSLVQSGVQRTVLFHRAFECNPLSCSDNHDTMHFSPSLDLSGPRSYLSCRKSPPRMDLIFSCRAVWPPATIFDRMAWGTVTRRALERSVDAMFN